MQILLFTVSNCQTCAVFNKKILDLGSHHKVEVRLYDIDDKNAFMMNLAAMRKYNLRAMPSVVLLDDTGGCLFSGGTDGIESIENLLKI